MKPKGILHRKIKKCPSSMPIEERFWIFVHKTNTCWIWIGSLDSSNYGNLNFKGKLIRATHLSWKIHKGEIPDKMRICHSCDNPSCVNPEHLFLGTQKENMKDCISKGRLGNRKGIANGNHKLTTNQVRQILNLSSKGWSLCKLSKKYNVGKSTVGHIIHRRTWIHI